MIPDVEFTILNTITFKTEMADHIICAHPAAAAGFLAFHDVYDIFPFIRRHEMPLIINGILCGKLFGNGIMNILLGNAAEVQRGNVGKIEEDTVHYFIGILYGFQYTDTVDQGFIVIDALCPFFYIFQDSGAGFSGEISGKGKFTLSHRILKLYITGTHDAEMIFGLLFSCLIIIQHGGHKYGRGEQQHDH